MNRSPGGYGADRRRRYEIGGNSPRERTSLRRSELWLRVLWTLNFGGAN